MHCYITMLECRPLYRPNSLFRAQALPTDARRWSFSSYLAQNSNFATWNLNLQLETRRKERHSTVLFNLRKHAFSSTCSYDFGVHQKAYHKSKTLFRHMLVMLDIQSDPPQDQLVLYIYAVASPRTLTHYRSQRLQSDEYGFWTQLWGCPADDWSDHQCLIVCPA